MHPIKKFMRKNLLITEIIFICSFISVGAFLFHYFEGRSYFNAIYYVVITMATIWYGDFVPTTYMGKILAMMYAFTGVPLFISISSFILEARFNKRIKKYLHEVNKELLDAEIQEVESDIKKDMKKK